MIAPDLERRLVASGRFEAGDIEVAAVQVNDFGEGEYEVRFSYGPGSAATEDGSHLARLRRRIEDVLPRAWVAEFAVEGRPGEAREVTVTLDYLPEGALTAS